MKATIIVEDDGDETACIVKCGVAPGAEKKPVFIITEAIMDSAMSINDRLLDRVYNSNQSSGTNEPTDDEAIAALNSITMDMLPSLTSTNSSPAGEPKAPNNG